MKKGLLNHQLNSKKSSTLVKIGQAAKVLGVSIDTLRRWEKNGKITVVKTPGGTRLYSLSNLKNGGFYHKYERAAKTPQKTLQPTVDLLAENFTVRPSTSKDYRDIIEKQVLRQAQDRSGQVFQPNSLRGNSVEPGQKFSPVPGSKPYLLQSYSPTIVLSLTLISFITVLITSILTFSYLISPQVTKTSANFFPLSPFNRLAQKIASTISPQLALTVNSQVADTKFSTLNLAQNGSNSLRGDSVEPGQVLAEETVAQYVEVNSDVLIKGGLAAEGLINGLTLVPSEEGFTISGGLTTAGSLTIPGVDITLDQSLSSTSSPSFSTLSLTSTSSQVVLGAGTALGTLTWTPTAARTITLPDATTTLVGTETTQTLKNKTISGSSNTLSSIGNSSLSNSSVTVSAGTNLSGGGSVSLGSSVTLSLASSPAVTSLTATTSMGVGTTSPDSTSVLDLVSTSKGMLTPRMTTTQRDAISSPATGLLIYNTTTSAFNAYSGSSWSPIGSGDFTLAGDSGTSQTISANDTLTLAGGTNGIDTVAGSTDTITLNFDATEVGTTTWGSGSSLVWTFNAGDTDPTVDFNSGSIVFNEGGADIDFRVEADANANLLTLDAGAFSSVGQFSIGSAAQSTATTFTIIDNPAITATANQNFYKMFIDNNAAVTVPTGTASLVASLALDEPNITATGTVTNAATLYLSGAPTEGSSGNFSLWVDNGEGRFENTPVSGSTTGSALTVVPAYVVEAADLTLSGVRIALDTNSNTDSGDIAYGLNVDDITTAAGPTEYAMRVGSGYDYQFFFELGTRDLRISATAPSAGTSPLTATIPALGADDTFCLATLGNCFGGGGGSGVTYTSQATNAITKFTSTNGQITASSLTDDGTTLTLAANVSLTTTAGTGSITENFSPAGTTSTARALTITPTFGIDVTNQALTGLYLNPNTNTNTDTGDTLAGVHIADITASSALESAIKLGSGWDNQMYFTDTSTIIKIANGGSILFEDDANGEGGDGNNICTITDGGDLTCTGSISGGSSGTQGYWSRTTTTLSPATANDVLSVSSTDNTNATLAITNNTADTLGAAAAIGIVDLASTSLTTGTLLNLELTESALNGGYYLRAWDATAGSAVFSVAEDGNTTIAGAEGSNMLTLTAGDAVLSDGSLSITDDDDAASLAVTNNSATTIGAGINTAGVVDISSTSLTTGNLLNLETTTALTSGRILNVSSTTTSSSFSGNLGRFSWEPGSATTATSDLFLISIGSNGTTTGDLFDIQDNSSSLFQVSETAITNSLPTSFTASGDVSIAYDINFTNPTASYIKSAAPLYLQAGETFNSSDLTLKTFNQGSIILAQDNNTAVDATSYGVQILSSLIDNSTNDPDNHYSLYNLPSVNITGDTLDNLYSSYIGLNNIAGTVTTWYGEYIANPTGSGTTTNKYALVTEASSGNIGFGDTTPDYSLEIASSSGPTLALSDSDVTHGVTTLAQTDVFYHLAQIGTDGGALVTGLSDAVGVTGLSLKGIIGQADPTDTVPAVSIVGAKANGTGVQDLAAAETVFQIINNDNTASLTLLGDNKMGIGIVDPGYLLEVGTAAGSDPSFALSDVDVIHGLTTLAQTDVFYHIAPISSTEGGAQITGISETDAQSLTIRGIIGSINPTDSTGAVKIVGAKSDGTTGMADLGNAETVFQVANNDNTNYFSIYGNGNAELTGTGSVGLKITSTSGLSSLEFDEVGVGGIKWSIGNQANSSNNTLNFFYNSGSTNVISLDPRTTTSGVTAIALTATAPTIASLANGTTEFTTLSVTPPTITLTGTNQVTSQMDSILFSAPTLTDASAVTIDDAVTLTISGAPTEAGSVALTDTYALKINGGDAGAATNAYSLYIDAPTGAGSNYMLYFGSAPTSANTAALCWDGTADSALTDCSGSVNPDYAEIYSVEEGIDFGEIVTTGSNTVQVTHNTTDKNSIPQPGNAYNMSQLVKSNTPYQQNIIGITSQNWGDFSSTGHGSVEEKDNPLPVALSGRVPVKVTTENGPIEVGDYLTSSSTPGVAMKATKAGQMIGKALEDYSQAETGKILVFVNISWADPADILANLSLDANGNLVHSSQLTSSDTKNALSETTNSLLSDLQAEVASLSSRLAALENHQATSSGQLVATNSTDLSAETLAKADVLGLNAFLEASSSATPSAALSDLKITETLDTATLKTLDLIASSTLKSLGQTFLGNTLVAGDFTIDGTMFLTGNSISSLGTLYLQNGVLADKVDLFNGLVQISKQGNITAQAITTKQLEIDNSNVLASSLGSSKIPAGKTSITISTVAISTGSKIFLTPTSSTGSQSLIVSKKTPGVSFEVSIDKAYIRDITLDWFIVNETNKTDVTN